MVLICVLEMEKEREWVSTHKYKRDATISWKLQNLQAVLAAFGQFWIP